VSQVVLVHQVNKDPPVVLVQQADQVLPDQLELPVQLVHQVNKVQLEEQGQLENRDQPESPVPLEKWDQQVQPDQPVHQVV
jgi:hypothetical protein